MCKPSYTEIYTSLKTKLYKPLTNIKEFIDTTFIENGSVVFECLMKKGTQHIHIYIATTEIYFTNK